MKKYNFLSFITIPLSKAPLYALLLVAEKIVSAVLPSLMVLASAGFIDRAIGIATKTDAKNDIVLYLCFIILILIYQYIYSVFNEIVAQKLSIKLSLTFQEDLNYKRSKLLYAVIENNDAWDIISRACNNPSGRIISGFNHVMDIIHTSVLFGSLLMISMRYVWWVGIVIIICGIPLFILAYKAGKQNYDAERKVTNLQRRANYFSGVLSGRGFIEERATFNYEETINLQWYEKYEQARKISMKVQLKNFFRMKGTSLTIVGVNIILILSLLPAVSQQIMTIGIFMGLVIGFFNLVDTMSWRLPSIMSQMANNKEYLIDLNKFYLLDEQEGATDIPSKLNDFKYESIIFDNVSFKYPNTDNYILENCSFKLMNGLHYAFVGVNGAGKTTIVKLLTRLYENYEGVILINDKDIRLYSLAEIKGIFSVVYQDFSKYYFTIKENIKLGNILSDDENAIIEAVNKVNLDKKIFELYQGLDASLGKLEDDGIELSGGEWQRIAIARSLYSQAAIHILDEPTASLDPIAEAKIYSMFKEISIGLSTIIITHRLGAARLADEILVLNNGAIEEKGTHDNLMSKKGLYCNMYESQKGLYNV